MKCSLGINLVVCFKEALELDRKESEGTGDWMESVAAGLVLVGSLQTAAQQEDPLLPWGSHV